MYPLKRVGKRGEGKWEQISWEQALYEIAEKMRESKKRRPNGIVYHVGRPGEDGYTNRIVQAWGMDGHNSHTNICSSSARAGYNFWLGQDRPSPDFANARVILLISSHLETGHYFNPHAQRIIEAKTDGAKHINFDPRLSNTPFPPKKTYYEMPIAIQDRSFTPNGSLFYPDTRRFFDGITGPYFPDTDVSPIWNPEFFGNTIMVNGNTWPFQVVEKRRYRFRLLNSCQSRFLILDFNLIPGVEVWQIGNEGGFLAAPVNLTAVNANRLLLGLAERADIIVDFTNVPVGNYVLGNVGPDEPFGGGVPGVDFPAADPATTGQVLQFNVVPAVAPDPTTPPQFLVLPAIAPLPAATLTRPLALIEKMGMGVDGAGNMVDGPAEALLGNVGPDTIDPSTPPGVWAERKWMDPVTENPAVGATEVWEIYNTTADAHPMHVHEVVFEVVNREGLVLDVNGDVAKPIQLDGKIAPPEPWETGYKDTVTAYPGPVTRIRAQFNNPGQFVWHCHIVEHEDNEMMRPYRVGPEQPGQPMPPHHPI